MTKSTYDEWRKLYIQLEKCISELTPEEVEKVKNYALALKARRIPEASSNPQRAE